MKNGFRRSQKGAVAIEFALVFIIFFAVFYGLVSYGLPFVMMQSFNQATAEAVRRSVLDWKTFRPENVMAMAVEANIPEADRRDVVNYVGQEFAALHEGNIIRYRLRPEDLAGIGRG